MIAPSLVGHPGLNSQLRAELGRSRGLCLHWKLRVEVAAWPEYSIAIPLWTGLYCSLCLKRCVPRGVRDISYLWPHGFPILLPCCPLPTSSWPRGVLWVGPLGLWSWCFSAALAWSLTLRVNLGFASQIPVPPPHFWSEWLSFVPEDLELPWGLWPKPEFKCRGSLCILELFWG